MAEMALPVCCEENLPDIFEVIENSLIKGRTYNEEGNFGRSFAHYLVVLHLIPEYLRPEFEAEFTNVLNHWGNELYARKEYADVFKCYSIAVKYFPANVEILNNLGTHALTLHLFGAARQYFETALSVDAHYLPAEQNLQTLRYTMVERWHFPMLNDLGRNKSYAQAIFMEIAHGYTRVLDVGTGTGILAMFASRSRQAQSVTACEYSEPMFEVATKCLAANAIANVTLVHKRSTELAVPGDLPARASLLVTEILDSGVFGENILGTLVHAWEHLLLPAPAARVIPAAVHIYVAGVRSRELSRRVRVTRRPHNMLQLNDVCLSHSTLPYDSEDLRPLAVDYVTEPRMALHVDFNSVAQLRRLGDARTLNPLVQLACVQRAEIDAFAIWFTLQLNASVSLSNDPRLAQPTCWQQAVAYLQHPLAVDAGEQLGVRLACSKGYMEVRCPKEEAYRATAYRPNCFEVPRSAVLLLNDTELLAKLELLVTRLVARHAGGGGGMLVLDVAPFPVVGLLLARHGARLTVRLKGASMEAAVRHLCQLNRIEQARVTCVPADQFRDYITGGLKFDVVFQNCVNTRGLVHEADLFQAQILGMCLRARGQLLPRSVAVWAQLVECAWLDTATRVDDSNVVGFKIAEHINRYKSTDHRDMNFDAIAHSALCEPTQLGYIEYDALNCFETDTDVRITQAGRANAVFYWFGIELDSGLDVSTRRPGAFVNSAAFMLEQRVPVTPLHQLTLTLKQHKGCMKIDVKQTRKLSRVII